MEHAAIQHLPSIRNRAMLVDLTFNKPRMSKQDRQAAKDAVAANGADPSVLKVQRMLYPEKLIAPIISVENKARDHLRTYCIEWGPWYIMDTRNYVEVLDMLGKIRVERHQEVIKFAQNWANVLAEAQKTQGDLFDASLYPDVSDVVEKFTMSWWVAPMGDHTPDLFSDVEAEAQEMITDHIEDSTMRSIATATTQPVARLLEVVLNIYDKTSREKTRIHESVVQDLRDLIELMPTLNPFNVDEINKLVTICQNEFAVDVELLRGKDSATRKKVAKQTKKLLTKVGGIKKLDQLDTKNPTVRRHLAEEAADNVLAIMKDFV